jgi:hypothetical protein
MTARVTLGEVQRADAEAQRLRGLADRVRVTIGPHSTDKERSDCGLALVTAEKAEFVSYHLALDYCRQLDPPPSAGEGGGL